MSFPAPKELLAELVSVRSVSGHEAEAAELVADLARSEGIDCERIGDSLLLSVGSGAPRFLMASHLDTVPVCNGWNADPFDGTWRDGRLTALGANDAKASVAAMLTTLAALRGTGLPGTLLVALTAREEVDNQGMTQVLEVVGPVDGALVGEPTGLEVVRSQAGLAVLEAVWRGRACHAAHVTRVEHENALTLAARDLAELGPYSTLPTEHELFEATTLVPTQLESGKRHNVVPDEAKAVFDVRLAPPHDAALCREHLERALPRAKVGIRSERLRAVDTPAGHPLVRTALATLGRERAIGSSTLSDMALLAGVPAVKCGPGRTERSHTANEFVTEEELFEACSGYTALVPRVLEALTEVQSGVKV